MKFVFALMGSRGDVQPALPVALELRRRGHEVAVGVAPNLVAMADRLGLDPVPVGVDSAVLLGSDLVRREMRSLHPGVRLRALRDVAAYGWEEFRADLLRLADGADVLVTGLLGQEVGSALAEHRDCGFAALHYFPVRANRSVPILPGPPGAVQHAAWHAGMLGRWELTRRPENAQRAALGLAPARVALQSRLRDRGAVEVQAYDAAIVPGLPEEWGTHSPFVGFLALADDDRARLGETGLGQTGLGETGLGAWLDAGTPPVYVGFGSMPVHDPDRLLAAVAGACADLGLRALVSTGWNDFTGECPDDVRLVGAVDHGAVLPRCAAAVHHGGAGTVAATLRAGVPSVVGWYSADQPVWGRLLRRAGVGTSLRAARLDRRTLRQALAQVLRPEVRTRARSLREALVPAAEAVRAAADAVEQAR